jgi:undecaprenyl-diphosphatase
MSAVMRDLSGVGSTIVLTLVTVGACGYLAITRAWRTALVMAISVLSAAGTVQVLKSAFARPRPWPAWSEYAATGLSFPSGHMSMSAVVIP